MELIARLALITPRGNIVYGTDQGKVIELPIIDISYINYNKYPYAHSLPLLELFVIEEYLRKKLQEVTAKTISERMKIDTVLSVSSDIDEETNTIYFMVVALIKNQCKTQNLGDADDLDLSDPYLDHHHYSRLSAHELDDDILTHPDMETDTISILEKTIIPTLIKNNICVLDNKKHKKG